jgi:molybdopterin converting factor small subunit
VPPAEPAGDGAAAAVTFRYWAAAKQAAGVGEETVTGVGTLADLVAAAVGRHPDDGTFARVLGRCSYLVDGDPVGTRPHASVQLRDAAVVEALPPFAGG